ncbi:MAG TPA: ABC transporter substrate-binding protein [Longimicrobiales bacterium]|nr:ABC transporter substrate-binding protein [Longimicrobiales bacterium]
MRILLANILDDTEDAMLRKCIMLVLVALAGCADPQIEVGVHAGLQGGTIARMAASGVRQSRATKDRRFDSRAIAQAAIVHDSLTPEILKTALDSIVDDTLLVALISRFYMPTAVAATRDFNRVGLPYISVHPTAPELTGGATWGFSLVPDYDKQAAFIARNIGAGKRVAVLHIEDAYGRGMAAALVAALTAAGSPPTDVRRYEQSWDEPRMVALGHDTRSRQPEILVFAGRSPSLQLVIQPFREAGEEIRVIGTDLVESTSVYDNPDGALTGVQFVRFLNPRSEDERMKDLNGRYILWIGFGNITTEGVLTYDGVHLVGEAVRAGARTRSEVRDYLKSLGRSRPPFSGVGGLIAFGEDGQVARNMELVEVQIGSWRVVATDSAASRR